MDWRFTSETEHMMDVFLGIGIIYRFSDEDRALYISKLIEKPIRVMQYKVDRMLAKRDPIPAFDEIKLFIYDGHDD